MLKYLRYSAAPTLTALGAFFALKGEHWMWVYFALFASIVMIGDFALGDDKRNPKFSSTKLLNFFLYTYSKTDILKNLLFCL